MLVVVAYTTLVRQGTCEWLCGQGRREGGDKGGHAVAVGRESINSYTLLYLFYLLCSPPSPGNSHAEKFLGVFG